MARKVFNLFRNGQPTGHSIEIEQPVMSSTPGAPTVLERDHAMLKILEALYRPPSIYHMPDEHTVVMGCPDDGVNIFQWVESGYSWLPEFGSVGRSN